MSLSKILTEDFLTCIICEERYEEPKILPCVHSFCKRCLEGHVKVKLDPNRHFPCPICRRECKLPEKGTDDLEKNRLLANLGEIINKIQKAKTQVKCEVCALREPPVDVDATKRCLNCDDNMCDVCSAEHRRHGGCRDHKIIPMTQLNEEYANVLRSRQQTLCNHDNKSPTEVFCVDCKKFICGTCVSLRHKDHDCKFIAEAATGGKNELNAVLTEADKRAIMITSLFSRLKLRKTGLQFKRESLKKVITKREEELHEILRLAADQMRKETDEVVSQETVDLSPVEKDLELALGYFASFEEFTNALLTHGFDAEVVQTMENCLERGRELMQMEIPTIPTTQCLTLDVNQVNNMSAVLRGCMGEVRQARDKELLWSFSVNLTTDPEEWISHVAADAEGHLCVGVWCGRVKKRNKINIYDDGRRLMTTLPDPKNDYDYFAGIAFDQDGNILARSQVDNSVMIFNKEGKLLSSFHSPQPHAVSVNSKGQYIIAGKDAIYIHDKNGEIVKSIPDPLQGNIVKYVAVSITGDILLSHPAAHKVLAYDQVSGDLKFTYGTKGSGDGQVKCPRGMCCLANGDIILADGGNSRLHLISSDGVFKKYLLTEDDGLKYPMDVALTPDGNLVIVEEEGMVKCFCLLG